VDWNYMMQMRKHRKSTYSDSEDEDEEEDESHSLSQSESDQKEQSFEEPPQKKIKCKKFDYCSSSSEKLVKKKKLPEKSVSEDSSE
jgi:hypothetical protein